MIGCDFVFIEANVFLFIVANDYIIIETTIILGALASNS